MAAVESSFAVLNYNVTDTTARVTEHSVRIDAAESSIADFNNTISENTASITTVESSITDTDNKVSENTARITETESSIFDLDSMVTENAGRLTEVESLITDLNNEVTGNTDRITDAETSISTLDTKTMNTGHSLSQICNRIDFLYHTQSPPYHCCANPSNNLMVCASGPAIDLGAISITKGGQNDGCLATDAACA